MKVIFSQFGKITSCNLVRDWKTNDSLQYAFIEFETPKACEEAYFKMNNVLIDNCRIQVDFSQSVSKLWNQFSRGRAKKQQYYESLRNRKDLDISEDEEDQRAKEKNKKAKKEVDEEIVRIKPKYDPDHKFDFLSNIGKGNSLSLKQRTSDHLTKLKQSRDRHRSSSSSSVEKKKKHRRKSSSERSESPRKKHRDSRSRCNDHRKEKRSHRRE